VEREKPLPWIAFIGCALTMLSLFIGFVLNVTIFGQTIRGDTSLPANLSVLGLLVLGIVVMYTGLGRQNKTKRQTS